MKTAFVSLNGLFIFLSMVSSGAVDPFLNEEKGPPANGELNGPLTTFVHELSALPESERAFKVNAFQEAYPLTPIIESDTVAGIYWYGKAKTVDVNGDLQDGWSKPVEMASVPCGDNSFFYISFLLPSDARVDYQLIVDSTYMTDPRNPEITPSGYGPHSQMAMPLYHPDPARARFPDVPRGTVDSMMVSSNNKDILPRKIKVYLPAGYENYKDLPVLYVMDGLEALGWMDYPNVLDNLIAWKKIKPMMAVFIPPGDRGGEFMGDSYPAFLKVLCDEIVPMIDLTYATDTKASGRGITGISAGGYFALMATLSRNDVFGCGAGQSPAITEATHQALKALAKKKNKLTMPRIYFDVGRYDLPAGLLGDKTFAQLGQDLDQEMTSLGVDHRFRMVNDGHEWANWRERTAEILQYFFR